MPTIMRLDRQAASIALCTEVARKAVLVLEDGTVIESRSPSCRGLVPREDITFPANWRGPAIWVHNSGKADILRPAQPR
jgi:hypothetical protein